MHLLVSASSSSKKVISWLAECLWWLGENLGNSEKRFSLFLGEFTYKEDIFCENISEGFMDWFECLWYDNYYSFLKERLWTLSFLMLISPREGSWITRELSGWEKVCLSLDYCLILNDCYASFYFRFSNFLKFSSKQDSLDSKSLWVGF